MMFHQYLRIVRLFINIAMKMLVFQSERRNRIFTISLFTAAIIVFSGCDKKDSGANDPDPDKGLKDYYNDYFTIGVAVAPSSLTGTSSTLILKHFGSLTAENVMKPEPLHPEENRYTWDNADLIVNYAKTNNMLVRGHTLVWHQQTPSWIFKDATGNTIAKDVLLARLKEHITQVVTRYKGKIYAWDVVNEALDDNDSKIYRETDWYKICGEEYIAKAFQWAHEADPDALLFYNDYNTEFAGRRDKVYTFIKQLLDAGVPIHGIGLQGHWSINHPSENDLRAAIQKYSTLGLKIQITELDVSVYSNSETNPADNVFTAEREQKQLEKYKMIFRVFREYKNVITGVTFWNVSDKSSWLDNFPIKGRKNYPLLFDQDLKPKKAYWEVVNF